MLLAYLDMKILFFESLPSPSRPSSPASWSGHPGLSHPCPSLQGELPFQQLGQDPLVPASHRWKGGCCVWLPVLDPTALGGCDRWVVPGSHPCGALPDSLAPGSAVSGSTTHWARPATLGWVPRASDPSCLATWGNSVSGSGC